MNNDLISRSALKKEMLFCLNQEITKYKTMRRALGNVGRVALKCAEAAPTVDAEVVRYGRYDIGGNCTVCGYPMPTDDRLDAIFPGELKYCYNCGAKMDGDVNAD